MSEESVPQIIVSTDDMTAAVNKLDEAIIMLLSGCTLVIVNEKMYLI